MKRIFNIILYSIIASLAISSNAEVSFSDYIFSPIEISPESSTGLNQVWVINGINATHINYTSATGNSGSVKWFKFSSLGAAYAEEVAATTANGVSTLTTLEGNMGYVIQDGNNRIFLWIIDYSTAQLILNRISISQESQCDLTILDIDGTCSDLAYYTINGQRKVLSREITLSYNTLKWDADKKRYESTTTTSDISGFNSSISATAPLCNTTFTLLGDRFLSQWGTPIEVESEYYYTPAVDVQSEATQTSGTSSGDGSMGGSAPVTIEFQGYASDATIFKEWQIATDSEFSEIKYRFTDDNISFTFDESGSFYARFIGANDSGTCEASGDTYEISIGESRLECPNAFSPKSDIESAQVWRVTYNSIVEFECTIFNRYGVKMCRFTNPSDGWDGKYKGKIVNSGVYFYVIKARGADGKRYNLKGDINILYAKPSL